MSPRYPTYDVLDKWDSVSFDTVTRGVLRQRLHKLPERRFFTEAEWALVDALAAHLAPTPERGGPIPIAPWIDADLFAGRGEGYRAPDMPPLQEAWRRGLAAIARQAQARYVQPFEALGPAEWEAECRRLHAGQVDPALWDGLDPKAVFAMVLRAVAAVYYAHPAAWSEMGFGGPASPRGYVRMGLDERDPWEAPPGREGGQAVNEAPRARDGRAPDVFERGGWLPMRCHTDQDRVDFAIVGAGAGGATLAARLAEKGFSVVCFDAGPYWRPLEDFASDETEQQKLYWTDDRITSGEDPIALGGNNCGRGVGGSTVHYSMIALRWRPEWFKARTKLGYGFDWPIDYEQIAPYYAAAERALSVSGPVSYPWGPPRGPYPYREHQINAPGLILARGAEKMGVRWAATPLTTVSAPRGKSPPCVYRGFCNFGCSTNAKQSALTVWAHRAVKAGAEIRDMAMVGRIETDAAGERATGVHYLREGVWRFQAARNVVAAGYAIETPRLLFNSASPKHPQGLGNSSGLVGTHLTTHAGPGVWAVFDQEIRWNKGPPNMAVTEHWNYTDEGKDFHGGYAFMSQGPLARAWAEVQTDRGLWGPALQRAMADYNHTAGFVPVAEVEPRPQNRVTLAEDKDQYGLPIPQVTFGYSDNDRRLQAHSIRFMSEMLEAAGGRELWQSTDTSHLMGTCRMGDAPDNSVVDADGRSWDVRNLWICDGSLFATSGAVNPSLTIQALALRIADRIAALNRRGELS